MTRRWKLTVEYDGTDYAGWQRQKNAPSVQEHIENAIRAFCGETVTVHVAGRTDAGVHATGQVCHADIEKEADARTVRDAINYHLRPEKIVVVEARAVDADFHARFSARRRVYCYRIIMARAADAVLDGRHAWHVWRDLDLAAMNAGARYLVGEHDFTSFRDSECQAKTPVRSLMRLEFVERGDALSFGRHVEMWAEARSFLHHQVRNMAGTLKMVGEGKLRPRDIRDILEARDRTQAGMTAPACGLHFVRVDY